MSEPRTERGPDVLHARPPMRARAPALFALLALASACDLGRQMSADDADMADYRAFRVAAHEGTRLHLAQAYLEAHPKGAWTAEVRAAFEPEEQAYFERAQASRDAVREYLADLPHGPHADAALALLLAFDDKIEDLEAARLLRDARRTEAQLEGAARQRRALGEAILGAVGALTEDGVYTTRIEDAPPALARVLAGGATSRIWGGGAPARSERDFFFVVPTAFGRQDRVATVTVTAELDDERRISVGRIEGDDLFVRWDEADNLRSLDASSPNHRSEAAFHAQELLAAALEARFPAARCSAPRASGELLHRACDGWTVVVHWAVREGGRDLIRIEGPRSVP